MLHIKRRQQENTWEIEENENAQSTPYIEKLEVPIKMEM